MDFLEGASGAISPTAVSVAHWLVNLEIASKLSAQGLFYISGPLLANNGPSWVKDPAGSNLPAEKMIPQENRFHWGKCFRESQANVLGLRLLLAPVTPLVADGFTTFPPRSSPRAAPW